MALYAGEVMRVSTNATGLDGQPLTPTDVSGVSLKVLDGGGNVVLSEQAMAWDVGSSKWFYDWNTTAVDPGTYRGKVTVHTSNGDSWEYVLILLMRPPAEIEVP